MSLTFLVADPPTPRPPRPAWIVPFGPQNPPALKGERTPKSLDTRPSIAYRACIWMGDL